MTVNGNAVESDDATTVEGKTATKDELGKAALEAMGYAYGDNTDAPWKEDGKDMPVLYFENTLMAATLSESYISLNPDEEHELTANFYGADALWAEITSSDNDVVEVLSADANGSEFKVNIKAKKAGKATLSITLDDITLVCEVTVGNATGINSATVGNATMAIMPGNGFVKAEGATSLSVYTIDGRNVANANGEIVSTSQMSKGTFVVVANYKDGKKATAKVIVK